MKFLPQKFYKLKSQLRGQILVTTLIILMLVSLTVVVITATVAKNNRQVFNNLEYEKSYNYAESRLISAADTLSNPDFDLFSLTTTVGQQALGSVSCESLVGNKKYYCAFNEEDGARRTLLTVEETNNVVAYDLGTDEYFDVILFRTQTDAGYRNPVRIAWLGQTALELNLIYLDNSNQIKSITEIVDPTSGSNQIFSGQGKPTSGFLSTGRITASGSEVTVNLQNVDAAKTGPNAKLRYLRVKVVNKQAGATISIQPVQDDDLPNQVRRLEAFSYVKSEVESSAPVVSTQLPLSPPVAPNLADALNFHAIRQPFCGNGVIEGAEQCDDGNAIDGDSCPNTCGGYKYMTLGYSMYSYAFTEGVAFSSVKDLTYTGAQDGKTDAEIFAAIDANDLIMIKVNNTSSSLRKFIDYAIDQKKIIFTNYGDGMDCWTGHAVLSRYGIFSDSRCTWIYPDPYNEVTGLLGLNPGPNTPQAFKFETSTRAVPEVTPGWQTNTYSNNIWSSPPVYPNWRPGSVGSVPNLTNILHPLLGTSLKGCVEKKYIAIPQDTYYEVNDNCVNASTVRMYPNYPCTTVYAYPAKFASNGQLISTIRCQPVPETQCMLFYGNKFFTSDLCMWWRTKFSNGAEFHFLAAEVGLAWKGTDPKNATQQQKIESGVWIAKALTNVLSQQDGHAPKYTGP